MQLCNYFITFMEILNTPFNIIIIIMGVKWYGVVIVLIHRLKCMTIGVVTG